jgi:hypothetical protein
VVPKVEKLVKLKSFFSNRILFDVDLQALSILLKVREPSLAHQPVGDNPSRDAGFNLVCRQLFGCRGCVLRRQLCGRGRPAEFVWIRGVPRLH